MNLSQLALKHGKTVSYAKNAHVFSQGENNSYLYVVKEGVLKAYYNSIDGKEYIKSFLTPGDTIASLQALNGDQCSFSLMCIHESTVLRLPYTKVIEFSNKNIETSNSIISLLMSFGMKKEQREYELLCLSAEQRYQKLLARTPNIYELVTQNDMARYLGITPVALSRIKNAKDDH